MIAKEYGKSPAEIEAWPQRHFDEALIILQATNRDKWPLEDAEIRESHPRPNAVTLLDHEQSFWAQFVVEGQLDTVKMHDAGYAGDQAVWIESEMQRLEWL